MSLYTFESFHQAILDNDFKMLEEALRTMHPADIAAILYDLNISDILKVFPLLSIAKAADVLIELPDETREKLIPQMREERLVKIIDEMEIDEAVDVIADLEDDKSESVLKKLDKEDSEQIKELMNYDEDSAGGLMQTEMIVVTQDMKRDELIREIRKNKDEVENYHYLYVVDDMNVLLGVLDVTKLVIADPNTIARDLIHPNVKYALVNMDQEKVADMFRKYNLYAIPVVDPQGILLGRITVDDIIDVIDEEASEDVYKLVGLDSDDKVFTSPLSSVKKRLPWLILNLFTAMIVSSFVGLFQGTIERLSFLAVLMPIVAGLGGNSGTQTLTVITRSIALGELTLRNTYKAIFKEVSVGLLNGIGVGSIAMLAAYLIKGNIWWGVVLGTAMITNMFIAGLTGSFIPVIMKALKIDPALASSVVITMVTDIGGFVSFLGLATLFINHLM